MVKWTFCQIFKVNFRAALILFNQKRDEIDQSEPKEKVVEAEADIYRCWIKYLIYMLENSTQNLMFKSFEEQSGIKVPYKYGGTNMVH